MDKIKSEIIEREEIVLNDQQNKMIVSGWGKDVLDNTTVEKIDYLSDESKSPRLYRLPK